MPPDLASSTPLTHEALQQRLLERYPSLSPQLQQIAQYVIDNLRKVALQTIAELAAELDVQPSAVIRLAKALDLKGFSDIQRVMRGALVEPLKARYGERVGTGKEDTLAYFSDLAQESLRDLPSQKQIDVAAEMLRAAKRVHICGNRRSFAFASHLTYLLSGFDAPVRQLLMLGDMGDIEANFIEKNDLLVAFSFPDYSATTSNLVKHARQQGARILAITNSKVAPVAATAHASLICDTHSDKAGFRSGVGVMVTIQALTLAYGQG